MGLDQKRAGRTIRLGPQRRTIRVRLAALLFAVFLASGAALLAVTFAIWQRRTTGNALQATPVGLHTRIIPVSSDGDQLLIASGIALALMAAGAPVVGWLVAGRFLGPLRAITATAREISATNLHERLNLARPDDELKELADTFNQLLDRLERSFAFERQFVANASHELRTPLAGMRTSLEVAMAKPEPVPAHIQTLADRLRRELAHVEQLLESFLTLAYSQQGPLDDASTVSLAELARVAIERRADTVSAFGIDLDQRQIPEVVVTGSQTLLARMVANVIDNAVDHNQPGGWIHVITAVDDQHARLIVENGGPVFDPGQVSELTQPFRRIGIERTGSENGFGLGLAIVSSIVEAHGGRLNLEAPSEGGLRVAITLPLAAAAQVGAPA